MLPTSYESSNEELDTLEDKIMNDDYQLNPKRAIQYARTIDNDTQLDKFMEALEDLGTFPFLPYDNDTNILSYFADVEYDVAEVARFLSLSNHKDLDIDYMTKYYHLVPIRTNRAQSTALTTYDKGQVIHDLKLYQKYPDIDLTVKEPTVEVNDITDTLEHHSKQYNSHVSEMLENAGGNYQPLVNMQRILKESYPEYYQA